ncbi:MAG: DUF3524 domain-containing protein [Gammaproteobacteria bacterium]|nr:DUF3524 domain-containing protein [Gammaproteobacteria bacterium]
MHEPAAAPVVWLLSAYRAESHAAWAEWLQRRVTSVDWRVFELPGRHFRWRIRGNPLSWQGVLPAEPPALIVATSMVDLATLKGLNPRIADVPAIYYFHENQFAYPRGERQVECIEPQMVQLYGALAAQRLLFNSAYNRDTFLDGVDALLRKMPDGVPPGVLPALADKSTVLPVPLTAPPGTGARDAHLLLWNHRWEYDKAPGVFVDAMQRLVSAGVAFRLAVLGARSEPPPAELIRLRQVLGERIVVDAMLPRDDYLRVVAGAAIVVSTAIHEFQGLAVMEATAAGCRPLVPDALCYPEQYPAAYRYPAGDAVALYEHLRGWLDVGLPPPVDMVAWSESTLLPQWSELLTDLLR